MPLLKNINALTSELHFEKDENFSSDDIRHLLNTRFSTAWNLFINDKVYFLD